jgi:hypothetical protein
VAAVSSDGLIVVYRQLILYARIVIADVLLTIFLAAGGEEMHGDEGWDRDRQCIKRKSFKQNARSVGLW